MLNKDKLARDEFTLSLGGMRAITSFTPASAIAHDRLRQDRAGRARDIGGKNSRRWAPRFLRVT